MGKYDDILAGFQAPASASSSPQGSGKYADILASFPPPESSPSKTPSKLMERISKYAVHPIIEGGSMAVGGAAGAALGGPAAPIVAPALAIATYPPAHEAANAVDRMMGVPTDNPTVPAALQQGAEVEAGGRVLGAAGKAISKIPFAKFAEGMTGSPASNFTRTFKNGLSVYSAPSVEEAGAKFGAEKFKLMGQVLTPEEQVAMVTNPNGAATQKITDVMTDWLKGKAIDPKDALMARQAADTIFPADTAKQAVRRGSLSEFKTAMNEILSKTAPEMKQASDEYASAKLKSQMLQPLRVNKANPNQPSKLGIMLGIPEAALAGHGNFLTALSGFAAQSPAFMGFLAATAGQIKKILPTISPNSQLNLARTLYTAFQNRKSNGATQ